jgi:hypothetical protein
MVGWLNSELKGLGRKWWMPVLSQHMPGWAEVNHEKLQLEYPVFRPKFEQTISRIQIWKVFLSFQADSGIVHRLGRNRFFWNPFQFIIHPLYRYMLYNPRYGQRHKIDTKRSLVSLQRRPVTDLVPWLACTNTNSNNWGNMEHIGGVRLRSALQSAATVQMCKRNRWFSFARLVPITTVRVVSKRFWQWCITQNYWGFGLFPSSDILENTTFRKLDLFPSSGEGGEKTPTQLGPLERVNHNHRHNCTCLYLTEEPSNRKSTQRLLLLNVLRFKYIYKSPISKSGEETCRKMKGEKLEFSCHWIHRIPPHSCYYMKSCFFFVTVQTNGFPNTCEDYRSILFPVGYCRI